MKFGEPSRRRTLPGGIVVCALALATLLVARGVAQESRGRYSEEEVVQALGAHVPPQQIERFVRQHGITFELTPECEARLRRAGATRELLDVLRSLPHPTTSSISSRLSGPLLIKSNPPGAQVFLDGQRKGITDGEGELQLDQLKPGDYKIRLTLTGYEDFEQPISLLAGQPKSIPVTLRKYETGPNHTMQHQVTRQFRVSHKHMIGSCNGFLTIGNGRIQYHPDNGKDSLDVSLRDITYGQVIIGGGFYVRPRGDRNWLFNSESTLDILGLLQQESRTGL